MKKKEFRVWDGSALGKNYSDVVSKSLESVTRRFFGRSGKIWLECDYSGPEGYRYMVTKDGNVIGHIFDYR